MFILIGCTLVNIPAIMNSFLLVCRKEDNFMELQLVREQFQSDTIGKDNFNSVEIGKVRPSCCTVIFVINGVKCNTGIIQRS